MDYRQHRYSPERVAVEALPLRPPLAPAWALKHGTGRLVIGSSDTFTVVQGRRPHVVCVDEAGFQKWALEADPGALALTGAGLLANADRRGRPSLLLVDAETGKVRQEVAAHEGVVVVLPRTGTFLTSAWNEPALVARSLDARMSVAWKHLYAIPGAEFRGLACDHERALVTLLAGGEGHLVCLSLATGKQVWSASLKALDPEPSGHWDPAVAEGLLVVSVAGGTTAIRVTDGRMVWKSAASGIVTMYGGVVYVRGMNWTASGQPSEIVALALKDGRELWRRDYPEVLKAARGNRLAGYLGVGESHIFSGDDIGTVWAFDCRTGEPVWRHRPKQAAAFAPWALPVIARGRLYIGSAGDHPHLLCYAPVEGDSLAARPKTAARETNQAEGLSFRIEAVHARQKLTNTRPYFGAGGSWTVLACRLGEKGRFFLAVDEKGKGGEGYIWVGDAGDGDVLLKRARRAFPARLTVPLASRVKPPRPAAVEVLGSGVGAGGSGRGTWTLSKWTGDDGVPEFYVNWSLAEKRGAIAEKDEGQRKVLLQFLAGLVAR